MVGYEIQEVTSDLRFPEGFRWREDALWFVDMQAGDLMKLPGGSGDPTTIAHIDDHAGGIGWLTTGELLVVSMNEREVRRVDSARTSLYSDLSQLTPWAINDLVVDHKTDRLYIGSFGFDSIGGAEYAPGEIYCVEPDGAARSVAQDVQFANKMHVLPGTRTLLVGETFGERLTAFSMEPNGDLSNSRTWAAMPGIRPDGSALDSQNAVWVADLAGAFVRVLEGGTITDRISVEPLIATECTLGGNSGSTLFMATATSWDPEVTKKDRPGRISSVQVEVPAWRR